MTETPIVASPVPTDSTLLVSASYDARASMLPLEFRNGAIYRYFEVPAALYAALLAADPKGTFFNRQIRPALACVRLTPPRT